MGNLLKGLKNYLDNTSKEQFEKDWAELEEYNNVGPNIEEFFERSKLNIKNTLQFIKLANKWYYIFPEYEGNIEDLEMVEGADKFLDDIYKVVNLPVIWVSIVDSDNYDFKLQKLNEDEFGTTYKLYNRDKFIRTVWLCNVTKEVLGEFPDEIKIKI